MGGYSLNLRSGSRSFTWIVENRPILWYDCPAERKVLAFCLGKGIQDGKVRELQQENNLWPKSALVKKGNLTDLSTEPAKSNRL